MIIASTPLALITGAFSGMGKDFALRFVSEDYTVYGAARRSSLPISRVVAWYGKGDASWRPAQ